ncbi:MAG: metallophosphoesterase family protein [Cetobacterium sp.]|uniref:metallophosphoesterase family protein n=1 Tax=Cetobacterium sp. TaxID=2071632 RepID=UPI003F3DA3FF
MKILHTSDWHLGKKLEGQKRIDEQSKFLNKLNSIVIEEKPDLILIAGDIFDTPNPSAEAEALFFKTIKDLSHNGKFPTIIIPGNHDNPQRLSAISPLAHDFGIIIYQKPFEIIPTGDYGNAKITSSGPGYINININSKELFLYSLPYPNEATLNETFKEGEFSKRIKNIFYEGLLDRNPSIPAVIMTHIFLCGSSKAEDEKNIELGGAMAVHPSDLPDVDYIALGHVHKPMAFKEKRAYYCGSPIEYRITENKYDKKILIATINGNLDTEVKDIFLENYKPIKEYTASSIDEAINLSEILKTQEEWIYLKIKTDKYLTVSELKKIKENKNILEIIPIIEKNITKTKEINFDNPQNILEAFEEFYKTFDNIQPSKEVTNLFTKLISEEN